MTFQKHIIEATLLHHHYLWFYKEEKQDSADQLDSSNTDRVLKLFFTAAHFRAFGAKWLHLG